jgi:hypothetical protein
MPGNKNIATWRGARGRHPYSVETLARAAILRIDPNTFRWTTAMVPSRARIADYVPLWIFRSSDRVQMKKNKIKAATPIARPGSRSNNPSEQF